MKTVLAPIDFSGVSDHVVAEAVAVARAIAGRLVLLNVVPPPVGFPSEPDGTTMHDAILLQTEKEAHTRLTALQRKLRDTGVTAHAVHQRGQPGPGILDQADRLAADYIVMGSHGHGAFYELLVGGTTSRVLKQAKCPVVIVPPGVQHPSRRGKRVEEPAVAE